MKTILIIILALACTPVFAEAAVVGVTVGQILGFGATFIAIFSAIAAFIINLTNKNQSSDEFEFRSPVNPISDIEHKVSELDTKIERKANELHTRIDTAFNETRDNKSDIASLSSTLKSVKESNEKHANDHKDDVREIYSAMKNWRKESDTDLTEIKNLLLKVIMSD